MSFDDAVRKLLDAPPGANVSSEILGGGEVQIGDYTWDTEPTQIEISAAWMMDGKHERRARVFATLPEFFDALETLPTNPRVL